MIINTIYDLCLQSVSWCLILQLIRNWWPLQKHLSNSIEEDPKLNMNPELWVFSHLYFRPSWTHRVAFAVLCCSRFPHRVCCRPVGTSTGMSPHLFFDLPFFLEFVDTGGTGIVLTASSQLGCPDNRENSCQHNRSSHPRLYTGCTSRRNPPNFFGLQTGAEYRYC